MKSLRALKAAGLVLAAVVLGLMTVQGSYALWNAAVSSNAGTVQSANFSILVNGAEMTSLTQPVALNLAEIRPGESSYTTVTIKNNTDATSAMRVKPTVTAGAATNGFAGHLTVQTVRLPAGQTCQTATYPQTPDLGAIDKAATASICFKATLSANTPATLLGNATTVPVTLTVSQMPA